MTGKVFNIAEKMPHMAGRARCLTPNCGAEWSTNAPIGSTYLKCPECELERGVFINNAAPEVHVPVLHCSGCNSPVFYVLPGRVLCLGCGGSIYFEEIINDIDEGA